MAALADPIDLPDPGQPPSGPPVLAIRGIGKSFPGVRALNDVSLALYPGKVTALIGENGAGKSTLVKILTGVYQPDDGEILLDGRPTAFPDAQAATAAGVTAIHQETVLFDELSVAENIWLGHQPLTKWGLVDWPAMRAGSLRVLAEIDADIAPETPLKQLSIAQRHLVAIARALSVEARVVIMDEPTAALSYKEIEELYEIVERLKSAGKAILFISHKFDEVYRVADNYTVFRDGQLVGAGVMRGTGQDTLVRLMVGRALGATFPKSAVTPGPVVLSARGLCHPTEFADISFDLRRGEILGFYGLIGSGRTELMQAIFGASALSAGTLSLDGAEVHFSHPEDAISAGLAYVPEERGKHGAILPMSIAENIGLASLDDTSIRGFLRRSAEYALARRYAERLDLRAAALSTPVGALSGGNQQKVVIGKWLATRPKVIILDEPTKGIDIGSKAAVHAFMSELAAEGLSIIMISSEIPEILGMSDRVIVLREGRLRATFERASMTAEALVGAATGNLEAAE